MDVTIVLVNYNTKDLTRNCLKSVYEKTKDVEFEIFIVDNNSQDDSIDMIEQEFPQVKLIKNSDNKGFGAANNIAIKKSHAKYIFCLNTDTLLINNAVKILYDYMEENTNVGACGGQMYDKQMQPNYSIGNFPTIQRIFLQYTGLNKIFKKYWQEKITPCKIVNYTKPTDVDYIIGADLMLRKSVLDKVGLFDENIFLYGEESDLCYRIVKSGKRVVFVPSSEIIHLQGMSSHSINTSKIQYISLIYWYKKNFSYFWSIILQIVLCFYFFSTFLISKKNIYLNLFKYFSKKLFTQPL